MGGTCQLGRAGRGLVGCRIRAREGWDRPEAAQKTVGPRDVLAILPILRSRCEGCLLAILADRAAAKRQARRGGYQ